MPTPAITIDIIDGPLPQATDAPVENAGGEARFTGRTRPESHDTNGALLALDYDMHEPLVRTVLMDLATAACQTHAVLSITMRHARGMVPVGEASVEVVVHAAHRSEAFAACRELIDGLKARAPIFKHERWAKGSSWAPGTPPPGSSWAPGTLPSGAPEHA